MSPAVAPPAWSSKPGYGELEMSRLGLQWGWRLGVVLLACLLWVAYARSAGAHALLVTSTPAANSTLTSAPTEARLTFSEGLEGRYSRATLVDASGKQVSTAPSHLGDQPTILILPLPGNLPAGTYTIQWKNVSAEDGHELTGFVPFSIGATASVSLAPLPDVAPPDPSPDLLATLGRWLGLLGAAAAVGSFASWRLALRTPLVAQHDVALKVAGRLQLLAMSGIVTAVAGSLLLLVADAHLAAGSYRVASLVDFAGHSRVGRLLFVRVALLLALAAPLSDDRPWRVDGWLPRLTLVLGGAVLLPYSLISHAAAQSTGRPAAVAVDWLHLACAAIWIGGLLALLLTLCSGRSRSPEALGDWYRPLLRRFSTLALSSVLLLVLTGLYAAWLDVGSLAALRDTSYGQALSVKLLLLVPLLGLGALNLGVVSRRLGELGHRLLWTVAGEIVLAAAVLLVVGVMTGLAPSASITRQPQDHPVFDFSHNGITAVLQLSPGTVGDNRYVVDATRNGKPIPSDWTVLLHFTNRELASTREVTLKRTDPARARFEGQGSDLSVIGTWQIEVIVRPPDINDWDATRALDVGQTYVPPISTPSRRFLGTTAGALILALALGIVLVVAGARERLAGTAQPFVLGLGAALTLIATLSLALTLGRGPGVRASGTPLTALGTPVATSTSTIATTPASTAATPLTTPGAAAASLTASATPTPPATPVATTTSADGWRQVGSWSGDNIQYTDAFTVHGIWRIRWTLKGTGQPFTVMIEEGDQTPVLLSAPDDQSSGEFLEQQPGTYNLMFHNTVPYEAVVEERP